MESTRAWPHRHFLRACVTKIWMLNLEGNAFQMQATPSNQPCKLLSLCLFSSTYTVSLVHTLKCFHTWRLPCKFLSGSRLKQHGSGDIREMFKSVDRTTFLCLSWSLGEWVFLSEKRKSDVRLLSSCCRSPKMLSSPLQPSTFLFHNIFFLIER